MTEFARGLPRLLPDRSLFRNDKNAARARQ